MLDLHCRSSIIHQKKPIAWFAIKLDVESIRMSSLLIVLKMYDTMTSLKNILTSMDEIRLVYKVWAIRTSEGIRT